MSLTSLFAGRTLGMTASEIRELLKLIDQPNVISFAGGIPDPNYFPREAFQAAMSAALSAQMAQTSLQYAPSEGYMPLREWIVEHMRSIGVSCETQNIMITAGSQQALDYIGKLYLNPHDTALVEWPTYLGALGAFTAYEPRFGRLNTQSNNSSHETAAEHIDAATQAGGRVKFAYLSPDFANPTGASLSTQQRADVLDLATELDCMIVEDAAYEALRYQGTALPSILAIEQAKTGDINACRTLYCGSFSKTLSPGLRVGWVVAAQPVIDKMVLLKQAGDLQTATLNQIAVHDVAKTHFHTHVQTLREVYGARLHAMLEALEQHMPKGVSWTAPEGGMFVWLTLPKHSNGRDVLRGALNADVAFVPGAAFHADGSVQNTLRLNFTMNTPETIEVGIARLAQVLREHLTL